MIIEVTFTENMTLEHVIPFVDYFGLIVRKRLHTTYKLEATDPHQILWFGVNCTNYELINKLHAEYIKKSKDEGQATKPNDGEKKEKISTSPL